MPPGVVAVVLVAAVAHAVWNTAAKYKRGDTVVFVWAYTCAATVLTLPVALVPVLTGAQEVDGRLVGAAAVSAVLHAVYSLTLQGGYDRADLGVVYPVARGTGPVLTTGGAVLLLGERPGGTAVVGAAVVVAGIAVVAGNPWRGDDRARALRGVGWGLATGATIAAYTVWDAYAVAGLHLPPVTYFCATYLVQGLVLTPRALARRGAIAASVRTDRMPIVVTAVLSPLAYILVLTAMSTAPAALVAPLRESSIVIGSLLAWWLFGEGHLARRLAGAAVVLVGVAAIALS